MAGKKRGAPRTGRSTKNITLSLTPDTIEILDKLGAREIRGRSNMVSMLITREWDRRGEK